MTLHQGIGEMPERGERLIPGGRRARELGDVFAGVAGHDLPKLQAAMVAPGEQAAGEAAVGPPRLARCYRCGER